MFLLPQTASDDFALILLITIHATNHGLFLARHTHFYRSVLAFVYYILAGAVTWFLTKKITSLCDCEPCALNNGSVVFALFALITNALSHFVMWHRWQFTACVLVVATPITVASVVLSTKECGSWQANVVNYVSYSSIFSLLAVAKIALIKNDILTRQVKIRRIYTLCTLVAATAPTLITPTPRVTAGISEGISASIVSV
jgi:hypothetical protein